MKKSGLLGERMVALFLLGVLLFNPPLLAAFDVGADASVMGIPVLFLYIFAAWAALIALVALVTHQAGPQDGNDQASEPEAEG